MTIESSTNTCAQSDTKCNPNPNLTTKQLAIVNSKPFSHRSYIFREIHTDNVVALFLQTLTVTVTLPM